MNEEITIKKSALQRRRGDMAQFILNVQPIIQQQNQPQQQLLVKPEVDALRRRRALEERGEATKNNIVGLYKILPKVAPTDVFPKGALSSLGKEVDRGGLKGKGSGGEGGFKPFLDAVKGVEKDPSRENLALVAATARAWLREHPLDDPDDDKFQTKKVACEDYLAHATNQMLIIDCESLNKLPPQIANRTEAALLVATGVGNPAPPANKGSSDSFFINGQDGKPLYIFKPLEGENVKEGPGESEGVGVVREVLSSEFNRLVLEKTGFDAGVSPTGLARLKSDAFAQGTTSQATSRVGAIQNAVPNVECNLQNMLPSNANMMLGHPDLALIPPRDVQKIAVLDFMTLQLDRNAENILINRDPEGNPRLNPIDGGFAFPSPGLFEGFGAQGMMASSLWKLPQAKEPFGDEALMMIWKLNPDEMAKGMLSSVDTMEQSAPELKDKIGKENIENMRRSMLFLKEMTANLPGCTPAEIGELYGYELKPILAAEGSKELGKAMDRAIRRAQQKRAFDNKWNDLKQRFAAAGGVNALIALGYNLGTDHELKMNLELQVKILEAKARNTKPAKSEPNQDPTPLEEREATYRQNKGDKILEKVIQRKDATMLWKSLTKDSKSNLKCTAVESYLKYMDLGGDKTWERMAKIAVEIVYLLPENLEGENYAVRAAFPDPDRTPDKEDYYLSEKIPLMEIYNEYR